MMGSTQSASLHSDGCLMIQRISCLADDLPRGLLDRQRSILFAQENFHVHEEGLLSTSWDIQRGSDSLRMGR